LKRALTVEEGFDCIAYCRLTERYLGRQRGRAVLEYRQGMDRAMGASLKLIVVISLIDEEARPKVRLAI
jgi:hypothetical protein